MVHGWGPDAHGLAGPEPGLLDLAPLSVARRGATTTRASRPFHASSALRLLSAVGPSAFPCTKTLAPALSTSSDLPLCPHPTPPHFVHPLARVRDFQVVDSFPYGVAFSWEKDGAPVTSTGA